MRGRSVDKAVNVLMKSRRSPMRQELAGRGNAFK